MVQTVMNCESWCCYQTHRCNETQEGVISPVSETHHRIGRMFLSGWRLGTASSTGMAWITSMILQRRGRKWKITMTTWPLVCLYFPLLSLFPCKDMVHVNIIMSLFSSNMNLMHQKKPSQCRRSGTRQLWPRTPGCSSAHHWASGSPRVEIWAGDCCGTMWSHPL